MCEPLTSCYVSTLHHRSNDKLRPELWNPVLLYAHLSTTDSSKGIILLPRGQRPVNLSHSSCWLLIYAPADGPGWAMNNNRSAGPASRLYSTLLTPPHSDCTHVFIPKSVPRLTGFLPFFCPNSVTLWRGTIKGGESSTISDLLAKNLMSFMHRWS